MGLPRQLLQACLLCSCALRCQAEPPPTLAQLAGANASHGFRLWKCASCIKDVCAGGCKCDEGCNCEANATAAARETADCSLGSDSCAKCNVPVCEGGCKCDSLCNCREAATEAARARQGCGNVDPCAKCKLPVCEGGCKCDGQCKCLANETNAARARQGCGNVDPCARCKLPVCKGGCKCDGQCKCLADETDAARVREGCSDKAAPCAKCNVPVCEHGCKCDNLCNCRKAATEAARATDGCPNLVTITTTTTTTTAAVAAEHSKVVERTALIGGSIACFLVVATALACWLHASASKMYDPAWAAISLAQLNALRTEAQKVLGPHYETATMHTVNEAVIQPACEKTGEPYARSANKGSLRHVEVFVSHAWAENFEMFVESVNAAFVHWTVKPNLWICATALLQSADAKKISVQVGTGRNPACAPFTRALSRAEKLLVVRNDTVDLYSRIWCCWEFFLAYRLGKINQPGAVMVAGPSAFAGTTVDIANAGASKDEDKRRILAYMRAHGGCEVINAQLTEIRNFYTPV